jgi:hypothetical protein
MKDRLALCLPSKREYEELKQTLRTLSNDGAAHSASLQLLPPELRRSTDVRFLMQLQEEMLYCGEVYFRPRDLFDNDANFLSIPELARACRRRRRRLMCMRPTPVAHMRVVPVRRSALW